MYRSTSQREHIVHCRHDTETNHVSYLSFHVVDVLFGMLQIEQHLEFMIYIYIYITLHENINVILRT